MSQVHRPPPLSANPFNMEGASRDLDSSLGGDMEGREGGVEGAWRGRGPDLEVLAGAAEP